jgi:hypothetical protein
MKDLEKLLQCEYIESDLLESIIIESSLLQQLNKNIIKAIITELKPYLKKKFFDDNKQQDLEEYSNILEEDRNVLESLLEVPVIVLDHIIDNHDTNFTKNKSNNEKTFKEKVEDHTLIDELFPQYKK